MTTRTESLARDFDAVIYPSRVGWSNECDDKIARSGRYRRRVNFDGEIEVTTRTLSGVHKVGKLDVFIGRDRRSINTFVSADE